MPFFGLTWIVTAEMNQIDRIKQVQCNSDESLEIPFKYSLNTVLGKQKAGSCKVAGYNLNMTCKTWHLLLKILI